MVDTVAIKVRPIKLIAVVFSGIAVILLISSIGGKEWVEVKFMHDDHTVITWGLWDICNSFGCTAPIADWVKVCAAFSITSLLLSLFVMVCGVLGLCTEELVRRRLWYIIAGILISLVALSNLLSLIIYPVKFRNTVSAYYVNIQRWDFDWTYGMGWGAFIFSVSAAIFFFLPIDRHELELESKPF